MKIHVKQFKTYSDMRNDLKLSKPERVVQDKESQLTAVNLQVRRERENMQKEQ